MQFEKLASPQPDQTPQMRYASLHRTIEKGMASDEVWNELARICLGLGFNDEAVKAYRNVEGRHTRRYLEVLLARHGLVCPTDETRDEGESTQTVESDPRAGFREQLVDSFQFLFADHMPLTVIVATLTFPLVVGLGGFLTAGSPFFLLPAIALLPGLSVLGVIGAMGRRIMLESAQGMDDPPPVPELGTLIREAGRFLVDMTVLCVLFLGPGILSYLLTGHLGSSVASLALGLLLMPMALMIRELSDDWRALSPYVLLRAVARGGKHYLGLTSVTSLLMLPAIISALLTMGSHFYLQISVVGPLIVVPLFVTCRHLGSFFYAHRKNLQILVARARPASPLRARSNPQPVGPSPQPVRPSPTPSSGLRRAARARPARQSLGAPSHPESKRPQVPGPRVRKQARSPQRLNGGLHDGGVHGSIAPRKGLHGKVAKAEERRRRKMASWNQVAGMSGVGPVPPPLFDEPSFQGDEPDLSNIPGAHVIKNEDRERAGASSQSGVRRAPR